MRLYERDYNELTDAEQAEYAAILELELAEKLGKFQVRRNLFRQYPKAVRHFNSIFPNNFLDSLELQDEKPLKDLLERFCNLLSCEAVTERSILNFTNSNHGYVLVASLLKAYFHFGHHGAYLFPEFRLGNSFQVDYLLTGKDSGGWHFVFIELESPVGNVTLKNGELGEVFRKGLSQIGEWNTWLEAKFASLSESFDKYRRPENPLPREFMSLDKTRIHYVVIAGRRSDFTDQTYRIRRQLQHDSAVLVLHYDNIIDAATNLIGQFTF